MDLVVPVRQEAAGTHPELRYALRSYEHCVSGAGEIWLLGGRPRWAQGINHMPLQQAGSKYQNVRRMLKHACLDSAVSNPFLLSNDDIFWLLPQRLEELRMLHGGDMRQYVANQQTRVGRSRYILGAQQTLKMLHAKGYEAPLSWSLHTPLVVHKEAFLEAIEWCGDSGLPLHLRSLYGAIQGLEGDKHCDVKLIGNSLPDRRWPYVSTADTSFAHRPIGQLLRKRFEHPSRWEN